MNRAEAREHDGEVCQNPDCGSPYDTVYRVPDEVWAQISPKPVDGWKTGGLLCMDCADELARKAGISLWWSAGVGDFPEAALSAELDAAERRERDLREALESAPRPRLPRDRPRYVAWFYRKRRAVLRASEGQDE